MGKADQYKHGSWNVICDYCGRKRKATDCRLTWDNFLVCTDTCWEPRQPQDFVRGKVDKQRTPPHLTRPDDRDAFTQTTIANDAYTLDTFLTFASVSGIAAYTTLGIETDHIVQDASGITGDLVETVTSYLVHWTFATVVSSPNVTIHEPLPFNSTSGRIVYILHDDRFVGTNEVTVESLG